MSSSVLIGLAETIEALFPHKVRANFCRPSAAEPHTLRPSELASVSKAVPARRREKAAGRGAARRAMQALGHPPAAVGTAPDRAPIWPTGLAGSISHSDTLCAAVLGQSTDYAGIGIDLEPDDALEADLWPMLTTDAELTLLRSLRAEDAGRLARVIFCAKEAAYKCQYPTTETLLEFSDLELSVQDQSRLSVVFQRDVVGISAGTRIEGARIDSAGHIICVFWMLATASTAQD